MSLIHALTPMIDLVFPPRCPLCGGALAEQGGLCASCWSGLELPGQPACGQCHRPLTHDHGDGARCGDCIEAAPLHDGVAAGAVYNPASRKLVLALKNNGRLALAPMLARMIAARLTTQFTGEIGPDWLVVPVPLHRWRLWRRGFNQSALLAREVAKLTGARLHVDALQRVRPTKKLRGMDAQERRAMLAGAIAVHWRRGGVLQGRKVLLIDDVLTSGATTDACIEALRGGGAHRVVIGCFARVLNEELA